jgi:hypothetical protein
MGHGFYEPNPFKRSSHEVTTQNRVISLLLPNPSLGHNMPAPSSKLGKGTSALSPALGQGISAPSSKLGLDATVLDHSWAQSQAKPVSPGFQAWIEPNIP